MNTGGYMHVLEVVVYAQIGSLDTESDGGASSFVARCRDNMTTPRTFKISSVVKTCESQGLREVENCSRSKNS
jgi:hypothetical protein